MERAEGNNYQHSLSLSQTQHSPAVTAKRAAVPGLDCTATANPAEEHTNNNGLTHGSVYQFVCACN